jgi:hypothetical protein
MHVGYDGCTTGACVLTILRVCVCALMHARSKTKPPASKKNHTHQKQNSQKKAPLACGTRTRAPSSRVYAHNTCTASQRSQPPRTVAVACAITVASFLSAASMSWPLFPGVSVLRVCVCVCVYVACVRLCIMCVCVSVCVCVWWVLGVIMCTVITCALTHYCPLTSSVLFAAAVGSLEAISSCTVCWRT